MSAAATPTAPPKAKKPAPPADAFWQTYSPHFEFPLSSGTSLLLHTLVIVLLFVLARWDPFGTSRPRQMPEPVAVIGDPDAPETTPAGGGSAPARQENVEEQRVEVPKVQPTEPVIDPKVAPEEPVEVTPNVRYVEDPEAKSRRDELRNKLDKVLAAGPPSKSNGTTTGDGGPGDKTGPGGPGAGATRSKRSARWVLLFNTQTGDDYLKQLTGLGAIVGVPTAESDAGKYMIYRNLAARPVAGQVEDVKNINRIYWVDGNPQTMTALGTAMGIPAPPAIVVFFPESLENDLSAKEKAFWARRQRRAFNENAIQETRFQVFPRSGRYELIATDMRFK